MGLFSVLREKLLSPDDEKTIIKANVRMISGCMDTQTSADVSNVETFELPDPAGRSGGAVSLLVYFVFSLIRSNVIINRFLFRMYVCTQCTSETYYSRLMIAIRYTLVKTLPTVRSFPNVR